MQVVKLSLRKAVLIFTVAREGSRTDAGKNRTSASLGPQVLTLTASRGNRAAAGGSETYFTLKFPGSESYQGAWNLGASVFAGSCADLGKSLENPARPHPAHLEPPEKAGNFSFDMPPC
jgi:hypothetical protein